MGSVTFDLTLRIGDVLQILTVAGGGLMVLHNMKAEAANQDQRLKHLENEMGKQTEILTRLASGEERMNGFDHRLHLLEIKPRQ